MHAALPVVVIGAGPIGLAAAAELVLRDQPVVVLEAGAEPAAGVRSWGHVRLFSPWSELVSPAAEKLLAPTGWTRPAGDAYPTGVEWVERYLAPLAAELGERIVTNATVVGVARQDRDLIVDSGREDLPFVVHVQGADGAIERIEGRAVIDASGTLGRPNPLGAEGYPVSGESIHPDVITYGVPDPANDHDRYAGRATAVVGSGASALTSLLALVDGPLYADQSRVVWVLRRGEVGASYGGGDADELPARGALGTRVRDAVAAGRIEVVTGFRTAAIEATGPSYRLIGTAGQTIEGLDQVVCVTGYRPDLSFLSEVRLDLDARLQAPPRLAAEIDPNLHSCGSVTPHGYDVLAQPEGDLYLAGMKSYGRAPTFLAMTGFEQVRSIAAALAGDLESAQKVELTLPDTGVCGGAGLFDAAESGDGGCCAPTAGPQPVALGLGRP
ncbi:FAD-dependent oxidoreductase [Luteipulveratus mongoliensis]|uniref:Flavoprotein n=1 Tax=Luteipulveratus mongoliensis TaxID=571913 RepID=A0A0K1JFD0_9MICO|nr:FAD-dependent oxidoreductase [Luteipulveratus mongoliensis]AKU15411.1 flavoprotein [Luteipulveratus mongoliensis]